MKRNDDDLDLLDKKYSGWETDFTGMNAKQRKEAKTKELSDKVKRVSAKNKELIARNKELEEELKLYKNSQTLPFSTPFNKGANLEEMHRKAALREQAERKEELANLYPSKHHTRALSFNKNDLDTNEIEGEESALPLLKRSNSADIDYNNEIELAKAIIRNNEILNILEKISKTKIYDDILLEDINEEVKADKAIPQLPVIQTGAPALSKPSGPPPPPPPSSSFARRFNKKK